MNLDKNVSFLIEGKKEDVELAIDEIKKIIKEEFEVEANIRQDNNLKDSRNERNIDTIMAGIALIVSIPGVAISINDVYERIKKKKKLENTIDKIKKIEKNTYTIKTIYPDGRIEEVIETKIVEILDQISANE